MQLSAICKQTPSAWNGRYAEAFLFTDNTGKEKTIFRYTIPFTSEQAAIFQFKYSLTAETRIQFYRTLVQGIQRHIAITNLLKSHRVSSILSCEAVEQEGDPETGRNCIFIQTEAVRPILQVLFDKKINILTLLDVFIRLSIIVRDIGKSPWSVSHRGINMEEVYLNADGMILLGGFFHATTPELNQQIPYPPDGLKHLPSTLCNGGNGSNSTDMQTIARLLYNFLSGLPWDTEWTETPRVTPAYAPEELAQIIHFGMNCSDAQCNRFRRLLLNYRKKISKTPLATLMIPVHTPYSKEFIYG